MHDQVRIRNARVDVFHALNGQNIARRLTAKFISAVTRADGNRQCVELGCTHEFGRFFRIGQHLAMVEFADSANAVFFARFASFKAAQATEFTFNRHAHFVCHLNHFARHAGVVFKVSGGFAVFAQRAVHHHRAKAQINRALANRRRSAVVLVHDQRNVRVGFNRGLNQMLDKRLARVFARASGGLQNHRCADFISCSHDSLHLFKIVHIERWNAVAVFGGVVEQLAHRDEHGSFPSV